jgi:hypothetical protein
MIELTTRDPSQLSKQEPAADIIQAGFGFVSHGGAFQEIG